LSLLGRRRELPHSYPNWVLRYRNWVLTTAVRLNEAQGASP
jgi:hypothetical protein